MVRLVATSAYPYAGRHLKAGEAFDAPEKDANLLKLIGKARDHDDKPKRQYRRRDLQAEHS